MKAFAAFILRGPFQAATVMIAASLLPFMTVVASGALALVTLRQGMRQGGVVAALAGSMLAALLWAMAGTYEPALRLALEHWLPILLLAEVLRRSVSLPLALMVWVLLGALTVIGFHGVIDDPTAHWMSVIEQFLAVAGTELPEETAAFLREDLLPIMTGLWVINLMAVVLIGLLLGRWLQAIMFNPGGLREEFHRFDLGRSAAVIALMVLLGGALAGPGVVYDLALVLAAAFMIQALAATHVLLAQRKWSAAWLVPVYLVVPFLYMPMALLGIGEALFQWRRRLLGNDSDSTGSST